MFNDRNDREDNDQRNRFFFVEPPKGSGPILSREGYSVFTSTFFIGWIFCVGIVIWLHLQIQVTREVVSTISGSAVDLAALTLAVLGVLHEFNKEDGWFKLGLFLVAFIFALDCLMGFYFIVSWRAEYEAQQIIDIVICLVLALGFLFQVDWALLFEKYSIRAPRFIKVNFAIIRKVPFEIVRLSIPFIILPTFFVVSKLTPLSSFLLIFLGGIIALLSLMFVTIVYISRKPKDEKKEDPLIVYSRQIAIRELETSNKLQILKENILNTITKIQNERANHNTDDLILTLPR